MRKPKKLPACDKCGKPNEIWDLCSYCPPCRAAFYNKLAWQHGEEEDNKDIVAIKQREAVTV